jgi:hypothetical protein
VAFWMFNAGCPCCDEECCLPPVCLSIKDSCTLAPVDGVTGYATVYEDVNAFNVGGTAWVYLYGSGDIVSSTGCVDMEYLGSTGIPPVYENFADYIPVTGLGVDYFTWDDDTKCFQVPPGAYKDTPILHIKLRDDDCFGNYTLSSQPCTGCFGQAGGFGPQPCTDDIDIRWCCENLCVNYGFGSLGLGAGIYAIDSGGNCQNFNISNPWDQDPRRWQDFTESVGRYYPNGPDPDIGGNLSVCFGAYSIHDTGELISTYACRSYDKVVFYSNGYEVPNPVPSGESFQGTYCWGGTVYDPYCTTVDWKHCDKTNASINTTSHIYNGALLGCTEPFPCSACNQGTGVLILTKITDKTYPPALTLTLSNDVNMWGYAAGFSMTLNQGDSPYCDGYGGCDVSPILVKQASQLKVFCFGPFNTFSCFQYGGTRNLRISAGFGGVSGPFLHTSLKYQDCTASGNCSNIDFNWRSTCPPGDNLRICDPATTLPGVNPGGVNIPGPAICSPTALDCDCCQSPTNCGSNILGVPGSSSLTFPGNGGGITRVSCDPLIYHVIKNSQLVAVISE